MTSNKPNKVIAGAKYALISATLCCATLAESRNLQTNREPTQNPFAVQQVREDARTQAPEVTIRGGSPIDVIPDIEVDDPICAELNDVAIAEGQQPIGACDDSLFPDQTVSDSPYSNSDDESSEENEPEWNASAVEDVILIHGFSLYSGHDCSDYWKRQKDEIEKTGRKAIILGFYTGNTNCDDSVPQTHNIDKYTPIEFIALQLRDWILANYEEHVSIDIVAHSMGGIVVRRMLDKWGQQLRISDVVTLGTPHNGVKAAYFNGSCLLIHQCAQQSAGSEFMNNLEANPQSKNPTQWTLIAASGDQVVGKGTAIEMSNGSSGGPPVSKYEYANYHKHGCANVFTLGHGDLQGQNAAKGVSECNIWGQQIATVKNPTDRIMMAID